MASVNKVKVLGIEVKSIIFVVSNLLRRWTETGLFFLLDMGNTISQKSASSVSNESLVSYRKSSKTNGPSVSMICTCQ